MERGGGGVAMARRRRRPTIWRIPDELWVLLKAVIPPHELRPSGGRPWIPARHILDGVLFVLRTGCQWKAVPAVYGSGSTLHRRFQHWSETGVWEAMWRLVLEYYDATHGLEWRWQSADTSLHKAPLGGEKNGTQPDRSRQVWHQAPYAHRGRRRAGGDRDHRREHPGQERAGDAA